MKNIVIATDSYKECISGIEVAMHIKKGFANVYPNCNYQLIEIADGGEGTTKALVNSTNGSLHYFPCKDSLNRDITSYIGLNDDKTVAYIEIAQSAGIELIEAELRNPLLTSTFGVGLLIREALKYNVKKIIIGLGSSATNDLGTGMLHNLGIKFFDCNNNIVVPMANNLDTITSIDDSNLIDLSNVQIEVACDVDNPLYGPNGATYVYSKQKGADANTQNILESNIKSFANVLNEHYRLDTQQIVGGGAAGGLGVAFSLCLGATLQSGFKIISNLLDLETIIADADLVITGEGRMDGQSINGKGPIGVAQIAHVYDIPCIAICGSLGSGINAVYDHGITAAYSTMMQAENLEQAFKHTAINLETLSQAIAQTLKLQI